MAHTPASPTPDDAVVVSATVTDDAGLNWVSLDYTVDGTMFALAMTAVGDVYSATIPAQVDGALVEYTVAAEDTDMEVSTDTDS